MTILFIVLLTGDAGAENAAVYNEANALYASGDYAGAIELYDSIDAVNPDLEYNRGAAHLKAGHIGKAALHFHRALRLAPGDPDTLANLAYIRSIKADREPDTEPGVLARLAGAVVYALSLDTMEYGAVALYLASALALFGVIVSAGAGWKRRFVKAFVALASITAVWMCVAGFRIYQFEIDERAVAVGAVVDAYAGPSDGAGKVFTFHEGTLVTLGRVDGNYVFATLASGYSGWVDRSLVERIRT